MVADDLAYKTGFNGLTGFFTGIFVSKMEKSHRSMHQTMVLHTDGNFLEIMDDILSMGINGIHPLEPGTIDIFNFKEISGQYHA